MCCLLLCIMFNNKMNRLNDLYDFRNTTSVFHINPIKFIKLSIEFFKSQYIFYKIFRFYLNFPYERNFKFTLAFSCSKIDKIAHFSKNRSSSFKTPTLLKILHSFFFFSNTSSLFILSHQRNL